MPSIYTFTRYSPEWPAEFEREATVWRELLGDDLVTVHHIGSTSVPGLSAKPIIDLLPVVRDITEVDEATTRIEAAGYRAWGEYGLPGRRYFNRDRDGTRTHNVHVYAAEHPDVVRHLAFCAYLNHDETARADYESLKREAYARHPANIEGYMDVKDAWIKRVERVAMEWYRRRTP